MTTEVSICSNALLRLGADPINSFDEADNFGSNIERARLAANLWPNVRRQVIRSHPWNCATKRVLLSPDAASPAFGFAHRFQLPGDWLRTLSVQIDRYARPDYKREGNYYLSDADALQLRYIWNNDNPATYDASLVGALEAAMTVVLAYPVTKSTSLRDTLAAEFKEQMRTARNVDGQEDPAETLGDAPLLASRFGNRSRVR